MDKQRFSALYSLAHGGDMEAKADLWIEFEFAYDHDRQPAFMNPLALPVSLTSCLPCCTAGGPPAPPNPQLPTSNANAKGFL